MSITGTQTGNSAKRADPGTPIHTRLAGAGLTEREKYAAHIPPHLMKDYPPLIRNALSA
jgi:hypothetical protein